MRKKAILSPYKEKELKEKILYNKKNQTPKGMTKMDSSSNFWELNCENSPENTSLVFSNLCEPISPTFNSITQGVSETNSFKLFSTPTKMEKGRPTLKKMDSISISDRELIDIIPTRSPPSEEKTPSYHLSKMMKNQRLI